jgi:hypothetical protein
MPSNYGGLSKVEMAKKLCTQDMTIASLTVQNEEYKADNARLMAEKAVMKTSFKSVSNFNPVTACYIVPKFWLEKWLP